MTLVFTFYFLFYMLRDREQARAAFDRLTTFDLEENAETITRFADNVHATVVGTVLVAGVQGTLGGLIFWWLGFPAPALCGIVMGVLAFIPALGTSVVWVPAAICLTLDRRWLNAALLAAWGGIIIAGTDNLLYPALVGRKLRLNTVMAFIGAVGGILWLGAAGLVLGPANDRRDRVDHRFRQETLRPRRRIQYAGPALSSRIARIRRARAIAPTFVQESKEHR